MPSNNLSWFESTSCLRRALPLVSAGVVSIISSLPGQGAEVDFKSEIQPIFTKYCAGCHSETNPEADLSLQSAKNLSELASEEGDWIVRGKPTESRLWQLITGKKEPVMPPFEEPQLSPQEKELLRLWIEQGAKVEVGDTPLKEKLRVPSMPGFVSDTPPLFAIATTSTTKDRWLVGSHDSVAWKGEEAAQVELPKIDLPIVGKVSQIRASRQGNWIAIASGIPGVGGQVTIAKITGTELEPVQVIEGHSDTLYTAVLSPDHRWVATAGYDRIVRIWNVETGGLAKELPGHNGAVYDLDFDPTGQVIATASADETIKVWNIASGERLDTYGQCEAEQYAVRFHPDGRQIIAVGADRRIRVWDLQSLTKASVSPMLHSVFAHETPVIGLGISPNGNRLVTAGEDGAIKLWGWPTIQALGEIGKISDTPTGIAWNGDDEVLITSIDGKVTSLRTTKSTPSPIKKDGNKEESAPSKILESGTPMREGSNSESLAIQELSEPAGENTFANPFSLKTPVRVMGVVSEKDTEGSMPGDWYLFGAKPGEEWMITVEGEGKDSRIDSLLDIYDASGAPLLRTRLQAVRESYFTFRGKDSSIADDFRMHRWEDMELNEYLYASGEVVRLWLYPRGPDSGFKVYPGERTRLTYFGTTATTHAINEPAWIVRELAPDEDPVPNGLPVFPIYYSNDDEGTRRLGKNSQLHFVSPSDGPFLVRVRDARGEGGDAYKYRLSIEKPNPHFTLGGATKEVVLRPNDGTEFSFFIVRVDGFEERVDFIPEEVPEGILLLEDLHVEREQIRCVGTLRAAEGAFEKLPDTFNLTFRPVARTASGKDLQLKPITLSVKKNSKPTMPLKLVRANDDASAPPLAEFTIQAGTTGVIKLVIDRGELAGDIGFGKEDSGRNLPHGVFVDNIGLSGLLIPKGESTRDVFITAARFVPEQTRYFFIRATVDGNPVTLPVKLRVVR